jgi:hypothetical protein
MNVSRRFFIGGAFGALGSMGGCRLLTGCACGGRPRLRFGVVSDVHVRLSNDGRGIYAPNDCTTLVHTLEWFRDQGVDGVMIAGDIADHGMVGEMEAIAKAWFSVFPDDRAPDGRKVARLFVTGNHDLEGYKYGRFAERVFPDAAVRAKNVLRSDYKGNWERIWHEPFEPVWMKTVNGYSFVGGHWTVDRCRGRDEVGVAGVEEFFAANGRRLDPSQPFFYVQHPHPCGTCYGPGAWGRDDGRVMRAFARLPNAIAFSGHSHYTLTDERSVWQGAFTSIGTASLRYTSRFALAKGPYANSGKGALMPAQKAFDSRQGMLVSVFDDHVEIARRDFSRDASLGDDWVLPLPTAESRPFEFKKRSAALGAPAFPADAKAVASIKAATLAKGVPSAKVGQLGVLQIVFPAALAAKARVFEYEVAVRGAMAGNVVSRVVAPGYHRSRKDPDAVAPVKCLLPLGALPKGAKEASFAVTPVSCYGVKGRALVTNVLKI